MNSDLCLFVLNLMTSIVISIEGIRNRIFQVAHESLRFLDLRMSILLQTPCHFFKVTQN